LSLLIGINIEFYTNLTITVAENPSQEPMDLLKKAINIDDINSFDNFAIQFAKRDELGEPQFYSYFARVIIRIYYLYEI